MLTTPESKFSGDFFKRVFEIVQIGNAAVRAAQEENRKAGIASVYSFHGKLYYELPDGTLTSERPPDDEAHNPPVKKF